MQDACPCVKTDPEQRIPKRENNSGLEMTTQRGSDFHTETQSSLDAKRVLTIHEETEILLPDKSQQ